MFALSSDVSDCEGLNQNKEYNLREWLDVIKFDNYMEIIEFMPELSEKLKTGVDEFVLRELFNIFYNFDDISDFPYRDDFHFDPRHTSKVTKWMIQKARAAMRFISPPIDEPCD